MKKSLSKLKGLFVSTFLVGTMAFGASTAFAAFSAEGVIDYANEKIGVAGSKYYSFDKKNWTKNASNAEVSISKVVSTSKKKLYTRPDMTTDAVITDYDIDARVKGPESYVDGNTDTIVFGESGQDCEIRVTNTGAWQLEKASPPSVDDYKLGTTIQVRYKATASQFYSQTKLFKGAGRPKAPNVTLDYSTLKLKGTSDKMVYSIVAADAANTRSVTGISCSSGTTDLESALSVASAPALKKVLVWTISTDKAAASDVKVIKAMQRLVAAPLDKDSFSMVNSEYLKTNSTKTLEYSFNEGKSFSTFPKTGLSIKTIAPAPEKDIKKMIIREKADPTKFLLASNGYEISVNAKAKLEADDVKDTKVDTSDFDNAEITIANAVVNNYSLDGGKTWNTFADGDTSILATAANLGKTLIARKGAATFDGSTATITPASDEMKIVLPKAPGNPPSAKINYVKLGSETEGQITGVSNKMEYAIGASEPANNGYTTEIESSTIDFSYSGSDTTYWIRLSNDPGKAFPSKPQKLIVKKQAGALTGTFGAAAKYDADNQKMSGKITGASSSMDFKIKNSEAGWIKYSDKAFSDALPVVPSTDTNQKVTLRTSATASAPPSTTSSEVSITVTDVQTLTGLKAAVIPLINGSGSGIFSDVAKITAATPTTVLTAAKTAISTSTDKNVNLEISWKNPLSKGIDGNKKAVVNGSLLLTDKSSGRTEEVFCAARDSLQAELTAIAGASIVAPDPNDGPGKTKITLGTASANTAFCYEVSDYKLSEGADFTIFTNLASKKTVANNDLLAVKEGQFIIIYEKSTDAPKLNLASGYTVIGPVTVAQIGVSQPTIAAQAQPAAGAVKITITGTGFKTGAALTDFTISGANSVKVTAVESITNTSVTFTVTTLAENDVITVVAKKSAFTPTAAMDSSPVTFTATA